MRSILVLLLLFIAPIFVLSQTVPGAVIRITVFNEKESPVENATVELLKAADSSLVKLAITDSKGMAEFDRLNLGSYLVRASMVNSTTTYSPAINITEAEPVQNAGKLILTSQATQLSGVTVTSKKPFIQRLNDRLVVNVENSIVSAGSSAMDVLERSPGVTVDQNDVFGLRGRQGVIIMIDGKPSPMNGADLANYLRGLPANAIERIEIITNPSAKYDAAGNSGIIDIRMKKDQRFGINGTFTAGSGQ
ncbi:MAG TPA: carboxypeptidase regulatory-like domain-containing protein, partial [Chitinophagaceae bacterium]|nr:carboxypeptidase regulatory-like domain-containing protein [Chitinophagaceae bacterium]